LGLASLKGTRLMVHALVHILSLLLDLRHLLCLDFLWVGPGLLLLYRYLHFLLRYCMMHLYKWLCNWCIKWDDIWWSWLHAMEMNMFSFVRQSRYKTILLGSQHHPRICITSTYHLLHSLLLLTTTMHPNYHKATHRCYSC
jgi:hypothetical protein